MVYILCLNSAVIVMRERYEEEWFVSAEQEKGISEDDRKSILQDMRDGMPVPDLPPQVKPSNVSRGNNSIIVTAA